MPITARDILWAAKVTLQDANNTRWTLEEMRVYLNDGLRFIAFHKPNAVTETALVELDEGTYQRLAEGQTLVRVIRNITSAADATPRVGGKPITPIDRAILDAQFPGWHDTNTIPYSATVTHVMSDPMDASAFYVYPGNTGAGRIEAIVTTLPDEVAAPGDPLDIDAYTAQIDIDAIYKNPLRDYVLSRCYEKDNGVPASAQRAVLYKQSVLSALGLKGQAEMIANVNTDDDM